MSIKTKLRAWIKESPFVKTFAFIISVIISGVLTGSFVFEITSEGELKWSDFYKVKSFYFILIFAIILYIYNRYIYIEDAKVKKFMDKKYCKAYLRSQCLPEIAKRYKEVISNGQQSDELKEIQANFERLIE